MWIKYTLRFAIALLLAGSSWWLVQSEPDEEKVYSEPGHEPDFFVRDFNATALDENGNPRHQLSAASMVHYIDDKSTEVTQPVLTVYDENKSNWVVESETGWMSEDGELVLLNGRVTIDRAGSEHASPLHVTTSNLRVYPKKDFVETDEFVRATSGDNWLTATGFQGWFKAPIRLKFLSEVRGRYDLDDKIR